MLIWKTYTVKNLFRGRLEDDAFALRRIFGPRYTTDTEYGHDIKVCVPGDVEPRDPNAIGLMARDSGQPITLEYH